MTVTDQFLTAEQKQHFLDRGHVIVHDCFSREVAQQWTDVAFERIGYDKNDPTTWVEGFRFTPQSETVPVREFAPRAWQAACELMGGEDRPEEPMTWHNGMAANFHAGSEVPWQPPQPHGNHWHVDGDHFRYFLDSPEHGLTMLVMWSDIEPRGGGTFIACDSIPVISRYLAEHPEGISAHELTGGANPGLIGQCTDLVELTGRIGDVVLIHPFMLHSISFNHSGRARFISNPGIKLREPMNFHRASPDEYSLVEKAILQGLGVDQLDFEPTRPRRAFSADEIARHRELGREG